MTDRGFPMAVVVFTAFASVLTWVCAMLGQLPIR